MVLDMLNEWAASGPAMMLNGLILSLAGLNHIVNPANSLVTRLFDFVGVSGTGIETVAMLAGIVVLAGGLGTLGNGLEMSGVDY